MPTYDYRCLKCAREFEVYQGIKEAPLKTCPKCKGKIQRQIGSGAGFIFKGSGFYATDYRKGAASPTAGSKPAEPKKDAAKEKTKD